MHAIILAAGRGSRLADRLPQGQPKCLLHLGARSLLARHLDLLYRQGMRHVDLVIGYQADLIIEHVGKLHSRPDVAFHFNPRYEQGSVISLKAAGETLTCGEDILLMDADVLYHPAILECLFKTSHANCFLFDRNFQAGEEPVKIALRNGRMVDFGKQLDAALQYDELGESVGFFRFAPEFAGVIAAECARFETEGLADAPYEEVLRNVLLQHPASFGFEDVTGIPWIEIDFPGDLIRAREEILPAIRRQVPDF